MAVAIWVARLLMNDTSRIQIPRTKVHSGEAPLYIFRPPRLIVQTLIRATQLTADSDRMDYVSVT
jgi:hypothetical protein